MSYRSHSVCVCVYGAGDITIVVYIGVYRYILTDTWSTATNGDKARLAIAFEASSRVGTGLAKIRQARARNH